MSAELTVEVAGGGLEVCVGVDVVAPLPLPLTDADEFLGPANLVQYPSEPSEPVKKLRKLGDAVTAISLQL